MGGGNVVAAELFDANPQHDNGSAGSLWDEQVRPSSIVALAVRDPTPTEQMAVHLVAYDAAGNVVADDSKRP